MAKNVVDRIHKYNDGRVPSLLKLKYEALKESPFRFFRGTCHLFYDDLPKKSFLFKSPVTWICGDLHLENFGSFKGDNRLAYFDMNDFDESLKAPCLLEATRLCTSLFLATDLLKIDKKEAEALASVFLRSYATHLSNGLIRSVEQGSAKGVVRRFLDNTGIRKRRELLQKRIRVKGRVADIRLDGIHTFKGAANAKKEVKEVIEKWARKSEHNAKFFKVIDVVLRVAGTGSIGVERYLALVEGRGAPDGFYLMDIKQVFPSCAAKYVKVKQPHWNNEAERLIAIQKRVESASPAFLAPLKISGKHFVLKELQPVEDKIDFTLLEADMHKITQLLTDMGAILAWNQLRCGGRDGSAIADEMIKFGTDLNKLEDKILKYASDYADTTRKYFKEFKRAGK